MLVVLGPLLAGLVLVGLVLAPRGWDALERGAIQLHRASGERLLAELRPLLEAPHAANAANAALFRAAGQLDDDAVRRHLHRQLADYPGVGYLQVGTASDGGFVGVERTEEGFVAELSDVGRTGKGVWTLDAQGDPTGERRTFVAGYDARTRPWYRAAVAAGGPTWSPIYQFSSRDRVRLGITAVQPWVVDGRTVGVLGADFVLSQLSEVLGAHGLGPGSRVVLVERDGLLVASSTGEIARTEDGVAKRLAATTCGDEVVERAVAGSLDGESSFAALEEARTFRVDDLYVYATPLTDDRGLDWVLVAAVPESAVLGTVRGDVVVGVVAALVAVGLGVAAAMVPASRITRPLLDLATAARELSAGRFDTVLPPATTEETQALVAAFDAMRAELSRTLQSAEEARRQAVDANRQKTSFLHGMSHELRTPLTAILGYTDLLLEDAPDGSGLRQDLERIRTAGRHLLALINDVLDLARVESGRISLTIEPVDVAELAREVAAELAPVVQARGNQLEVEVGAGDPVVSGDRARLRQILVNLVGNAAKFTDGGVVRLVVSPERDLVVASVQDTGIGFAPELLEKLFQPYERAPGVGGREGTGLGLAIVRRLVQVLGGRLVVTSALGEGSTFALRLPRRFPGQA